MNMSDQALLRDQILGVLSGAGWCTSHALFQRSDAADIQPIHDSLRRLVRSGEVKRALGPSAPVYALPDAPDVFAQPPQDCARSWPNGQPIRSTRVSRRPSPPTHTHRVREARP